MFDGLASSAGLQISKQRGRMRMPRLSSKSDAFDLAFVAALACLPESMG